MLWSSDRSGGQHYSNLTAVAAIPVWIDRRGGRIVVFVTAVAATPELVRRPPAPYGAGTNGRLSR